MDKLSKMIALLVHFSQKLKIITVSSKSQENLPPDLPPNAGWRKAFMLAFGTAFSLEKKTSVFLLSGVAATLDRKAQSRECNQGQGKLTPCSVCQVDP